jgi:predicted nuclease of predicted toxin-antitoxin system
MRFLVDECLATRLAAVLRDAGHDAVHVADLDLLGAADTAVMAAATQDERVLLSADTDFGELLAAGKLDAPSVVLFRGAATSERRAALLLANLEQFEDAVLAGAIVVLSSRIRIRYLPVS